MGDAADDGTRITPPIFGGTLSAWVTSHLAGRPGLWIALCQDARAFAAHRMERVFDGGWRLWLDMVRLVWVSEDYFGVALYRIRTALSRAHVPLLPLFINKICTAAFGIRIGNYTVIREGVYFPHGDVVIDGGVYVGRWCEICPWVTLGLVQGVGIGPRLEDHVYVGTGAKILGPVRIGEGARVGAGAVVLRDVPPYATVVGVPARVIDADWRLAPSEGRWAAERAASLINAQPPAADSPTLDPRA